MGVLDKPDSWGAGTPMARVFGQKPDPKPWFEYIQKNMLQFPYGQLPSLAMERVVVLLRILTVDRRQSHSRKEHYHCQVAFVLFGRG